MRFWWTSDNHFSHFNIIRYCNRPFSSVEEMDAKMIANWNGRVKPEDTVFELGDYNFRNSPGGKKGEGTTNKAIDYDKQLNGKIIHIVGNHTRNNGCKTIIENMVIRYGGHRVFMVHKPEHFNKKYKFTFCGHVHNRWAIKEVEGCILLNVGVDVNNFAPVSFEELMKKYYKWKREEQWKKEKKS